MIHKKFKDERICDGCGCNFLCQKGYEKVQVSCLGCAELPELPKEEKGVTVEQGVGVAKDNSVKQENPENKENVGVCKKCFKGFTPTSPANKICPVCKEKK